MRNRATLSQLTVSLVTNIVQKVKFEDQLYFDSLSALTSVKL